MMRYTVETTAMRIIVIANSVEKVTIRMNHVTMMMIVAGKQ